ncbi:MAG: hypothetical protein QOJ79_3345 [Actinomycetota bacterium]|nr:hypothetical protein [Actinomycetota bacterium]
MRHPRLAAAAVTVVALVTLGGSAPAFASNSGDGSDYNANPNASDCGQYHGAFNAFGKDYNFAGGADGQKTGAANSAKGCQNNL